MLGSSSTTRILALATLHSTDQERWSAGQSPSIARLLYDEDAASETTVADPTLNSG
jgi:hypothetical protein